MTLTQQEAYIELRTRLDTINETITEAEKFARDHNLAMGQSRYNVGTFETVLTDEDGMATDEDGNLVDPYEDWISSQVCW